MAEEELSTQLNQPLIDRHQRHPLEEEEEELQHQQQLQCQQQQWRQDQYNALMRRPSTYNATSQVALVGARVCPIESLDYEILENDLFNQDWRSRSRSHIFQYICMKWTLCFLVGIFAGLVGFFNNLSIENVAGMKFVVTSNMMLEHKYAQAFMVFTASNFVLTLLSTVITAFVAPMAAGSGIPEVKAYLNGVDAPGIFSPRTLIVKAYIRKVEYQSYLPIYAIDGEVQGEEKGSLHVLDSIKHIVGLREIPWHWGKGISKEDTLT